MGQGTGTMREPAPLAVARRGGSGRGWGSWNVVLGLSTHCPPPLCQAAPCPCASLGAAARGAQGAGWEGSSRVGKVPPHPPRIESSKLFGWSWKTDLKLPSLTSASCSTNTGQGLSVPRWLGASRLAQPSVSLLVRLPSSSCGGVWSILLPLSTMEGPPGLCHGCQGELDPGPAPSPLGQA